MRARNEASEAGFTLIELLVVIVILGVLSAIVVFSVRGINDKGQGSACKTDKSTIQTAEEAYFATDNRGAYGTMTQLVDGGFLSNASSWYEVAPSGNTYNITPKTLPAGQANPCNGI
ncbi:competence type IV pilus major pilin ComGC [Streptomyces sp. NRRL S-237]|uniref:competence type IV pilus major pilin ComGC n=1 Tax=Streptomyces sp. NRRL S-237 TaxID=1463895 RepID=UPI000A8C85A3|nr:prepilin-type N-terminal cleavage/methylation domain-containing protein [Streptomyces sp. NRRL S-237]